MEPAGSDALPSAVRAVFGTRSARAEAYRATLADEGVTLGLIGPREVPRLWERHILNCAVLGELIEENARVVDIGSGAGLPGIPLALARPDLRVTLIEPLLRRSEFLHRVVEDLGLDVRVVRGRAEEKAVRADVGGADVVTSRAVAPLERLAKWSGPLIRDGGQMMAIKGSSASDELARDRTSVNRLGITRLHVKHCGESVVDVPTTVIIGVKRRDASGRPGGRGRRGGNRGAASRRGASPGPRPSG